MNTEILNPSYCTNCFRIVCSECGMHNTGITSTHPVEGEDHYMKRARWQCQTCHLVFYTLEGIRRFKKFERSRENLSKTIHSDLLRSNLIGNGLAYLLEGGTLLGVCKMWGVLPDQAKYITRHEGLRRISNGQYERWVVQDTWVGLTPFLESYIDQQYQDWLECERIAYLAHLHGVELDSRTLAAVARARGEQS